MLEELLGKKIIVKSTERHGTYRHLNVHYVGILQPSPEGEINLTDWNDNLYSYSPTGGSIGLDTRPTDRSKCVFIPRAKMLHAHELDASKLERKYYFFVGSPD